MGTKSLTVFFKNKFTSYFEEAPSTEKGSVHINDDKTNVYSFSIY